MNVVNLDGLYGFHPTGAMTVRADASVHLVSEDVAATVLAALIARDSSEAMSAD